MTKAKKWSVLLLLVLVAWFTWGLYLHGTRHFCNGYRLLWMNGAEAVIADAASHVVTSGTVT
jgi:hypothetical protein